MERIAVSGEKMAEVKSRGQELPFPAAEKSTLTGGVSGIWKRILFKVMYFFQVKAESDWKNEINCSKWECKKWWYWQ